ncbi:hypothetical protein Dimus_022167 [Dionaea muscipula]
MGDGHQSLLSLTVFVGTVAADLGSQLQAAARKRRRSRALPLPSLSGIVDADLATVGAGPVVAVEWATRFRKDFFSLLNDGKISTISYRR